MMGKRQDIEGGGGQEEKNKHKKTRRAKMGREDR
jgi:hypothetical protein